MQKIEDQNSSSVSGSRQQRPMAESVPAQTPAPAVRHSSGFAAKSGTATSAPAAKTAEKGAIVSEISEKQTSWDSAPVDSVGVDAADEALAYETVAKGCHCLQSAPAARRCCQSSAPPQVAQSRNISIDDVVKVDLRVAQILVAERVPKADKLLRLEVDLGYEKRQILAGIAQYYEPEKLIGRKIVIVANLAPRKMRGLESNGMLLAASLEGGAPVLAGFLEDVPLGARLK
jgi:methionyl-tRNA synthetase